MLVKERKVEVCHLHGKTKERLRLTDGVRHPVIIKKLNCTECHWKHPDTCRDCKAKDSQ